MVMYKTLLIGPTLQSIKYKTSLKQQGLLMLKRIILSLLMINCVQVAFCEQQTYTADSINIYPVNVSQPKSSGWQLKDQTNMNVVFTNSSTSESRLAYASLFLTKTPRDKDNVLAIAKQNIETTLKQTGGIPISQTHAYTEELQYPCVKSALSASLKITQADGSAAEIPMQYRFLICITPEENTGFMAGFSYIGKKPIVQLDKEANEFLTGVRYRHPSNSGEVNALWNTYDGFGIWIYPESGTCDEIRKRVKSFMVVAPNENIKSGKKVHLPIMDVKFCADFFKGVPNAKCNSGSIDIEFDEATKEYSGYFDVTMSNGLVKRGKFRASYCEVSK